MKTKTTKLWLRSTSRYPAPEAFILCRTAQESVERSLTAGETLAPIIVKLTNSSHAYCGRGAWSEWEHHGPRSNRKATLWKRVLVRVGSPEKFPRKVCYHSFKDMPEFEFLTYREAIVGVTAHEMGHALGYSGRKSGEEKCEMLAWDALDYYRKHQLEIDAEIDAALQQRTQKELAERNAKSPIQIAGTRFLEAKAKLAQWQRKAKLAATKIKHYTRLMKRREREMNRQGWIDSKLVGVDTSAPGADKTVAVVTAQVDRRLDAIEQRDKLAATPPTHDTNP